MGARRARPSSNLVTGAPGGADDSKPRFDIRPGDPLSPVLLHVPRASRVIPGWVRAGIVLDDEGLAREATMWSGQNCEAGNVYPTNVSERITPFGFQ